MSLPILDPKKVPKGWVTDIFGLVHPPAYTLWFGPVNGFEIRADGSVYVIEDGEQRQAEWPESAQIRNSMIEAFGPSIARAAGIEPE